MKILFVCKGNMFRSQLAEAIAGKLIGSENVRSAGSYTGATDEPEGLVLKNLSTIFKKGYEDFDAFLQFAKEKGIDLYDHKTKKLREGDILWADIIVDMTEKPFGSKLLENNPKVVKWNIENNCGKMEGIYPDMVVKINELLKTNK